MPGTYWRLDSGYTNDSFYGKTDANGRMIGLPGSATNRSTASSTFRIRTSCAHPYSFLFSPEQVASKTLSSGETWDLTEYQQDNRVPPKSYWQFNAVDAVGRSFYGKAGDNGRMIGLPNTITNASQNQRTFTIYADDVCPTNSAFTKNLPPGETWDLTEFQIDHTGYPNGYWRLQEGDYGPYLFGRTNADGRMIDLPNSVTNTAIFSYMNAAVLIYCECYNNTTIASKTLFSGETWDLTEFQRNNAALPDHYWMLYCNDYTFYFGETDSNGRMIGLPNSITAGNTSLSCYIESYCECPSNFAIAATYFSSPGTWDLTGIKVNPIKSLANRYWTVRANNVVIFCGIIDADGYLIGPDSVDVGTGNCSLEVRCNCTDFTIANKTLSEGETWSLTEFQRDYVAIPNHYWRLYRTESGTPIRFSGHSCGKTDNAGRMIGLPEFVAEPGNYTLSSVCECTFLELAYHQFPIVGTDTWDLTEFQRDRMAYPNGYWAIYGRGGSENNDRAFYFGETDANGRMIGLPDSVEGTERNYVWLGLYNACECMDYPLKFSSTDEPKIGATFPHKSWRATKPGETSCSGIIDENGYLVGIPGNAIEGGWTITAYCVNCYVEVETTPINLSSLTAAEREELGL